MLKKIVLTATMAFTGLMIGNIALAEDGAALYAAKTCNACHGSDAKGMPGNPLFPSLAGQHKEYALAQIKDIISGTRANGQSAVMAGALAAQKISDAELEAIATWLSSLK